MPEQQYYYKSNKISGNNTNFVGTRAKWNSMTRQERSIYDTIDFTDEMNNVIIDDYPTEGSQNLVRSGGVYAKNQTLTNQVSSLNSALTNKVDNEIATRSKSGAKNYLPNTRTSKVQNGVTITVNPDGSMTLSGTCTARIDYYTTFSLKAGTYIFSGTSPDLSFSNEGYIGIYKKGIFDIQLSEQRPTQEFTLNEDQDNITSRLVIRSGAVFSTPITVFPMIRLATDASSDYEPYSMTNQELTPIAQAVSNRNLLDNPWFTVNQREKTSWSDTSEYGFCADRWTIPSSSTGSIQNGVISNSQAVYQKMEDSRILPLLGKKVTLSWMLSDGTIESKTATFPSSLTSSFAWVFTNNKVTVGLRDGNQSQCPRIQANISVKAVKLELGSVSTLAMDVAPNYATELLKCQRYFQRVKASNNWTPMFTGLYTNDSVRAILPLLVALRTTPTLSVSDATKLTAYCNGQTATGASLSVNTYKDNDSKLYLSLTVASGITSTNYIAIVFANDADFYIDLSADL